MIFYANITNLSLGGSDLSKKSQIILILSEIVVVRGYGNGVKIN